MSTPISIPTGPISELAALLATGILRLQARAALNSAQSPESVAASLEVLPPAPLSVTASRVNGAEISTQTRSDA